MAIPDFQTLMRPILEAHTHTDTWTRAPLVDHLATRFGLSDEDRAVMLPSGRQRTFDNRIAWSITHLSQAGLLSRPRRGVTALTDRGRDVLARHPDRVDMTVLNEFAEYRAFRSGSTDDVEGDTAPAAVAISDDTPDEVIEAGERLGQSGDAGIDGVVREDVLGLNAIYLQAKRWDPGRSVGRPDVQAFVGALHGARASKGVFITTSSFTREARDYAASVTPRVVLIGGRRLAELMISYDVGVSATHTYQLKRIDTDYFEADALDV